MGAIVAAHEAALRRARRDDRPRRAERCGGVDRLARPARLQGGGPPRARHRLAAGRQPRRAARPPLRRATVPARRAGHAVHALPRPEPRARPVAERRRRLQRPAPLPEDRDGARRQRPGRAGRGGQRVRRRCRRRAGRAGSTTIRPACDVWLVATGAEERPYTGQADHLGARRLVKHVRQQRSARRLRYALSLDMVGRGGRFQVSSPHAGPRPRVEGQVLAAGRRGDVTLRFDPDSRDRQLGPPRVRAGRAPRPRHPPVARARALLPQRLRHVAAAPAPFAAPRPARHRARAATALA